MPRSFGIGRGCRRYSIRAGRICRSNDRHVALARVSGARLLLTDDGSLESDFKNAGLLPPAGQDLKRHTATSQPTGSVWSVALPDDGLDYVQQLPADRRDGPRQIDGGEADGVPLDDDRFVNDRANTWM